MTSGTERTTRGWRFFAAQVIYYLGITIVGVLTVGMFGLLVWMFYDMVPAEGKAIAGVLFGGFALLVGYGALFSWAEKIREEYRGN